MKKAILLLREQWRLAFDVLGLRFLRRGACNLIVEVKSIIVLDSVNHGVVDAQLVVYDFVLSVHPVSQFANPVCLSLLNLCCYRVSLILRLVVVQL